MAGRPVTTRGGLSGLHYAVIVLVILNVATLGLWIFALTQVKSAQDTAETAQKAARDFGTPPAYYAEEATNRHSQVATVMTDDLRKLGQLVSGQPDAVALTLTDQSNQVLSDAAGRNPGIVNPTDTLLTAIRRLDGALGDQKDKAAALMLAVTDGQSEVQGLTAQLKLTRDEFEGQVKALGEQVRQTEEDKVRQLQSKDEQLTALQTTLDSREQQLVTLKREGTRREQQKDLEIARLQKEVAALQELIKDLKPGSFDPNAILTKADGRVLRAIPGSDVVYINLGARDKVKVGMGFEIYSQTREVPRGLRGKASIEVVTLLDDTSECRITRNTPGQPIIEGDIVVNVAFERGRLPKFVIAGEFDLNYDGVPDFDGTERVVSMIREMGGQVVPELDESVDFVVIGLGPQSPQFAPGAQVTDVVKDQAEQKRLEQSRFRALLDRARSLYIPVVTQNQFLFLTGYAGDSPLVKR